MAVPQEVIDYFTSGAGAGYNPLGGLLGQHNSLFKDSSGQYWRGQFEGGSPAGDSSDGGGWYLSDIRTTTPTGVQLGVSEDIYGLDGASRGSYVPKKEADSLAKGLAMVAGAGFGLNALGGMVASGAAGAGGGFVPSGGISAGYSPAADGLIGSAAGGGGAAAGGLDLGGGLFMGADGAITGALPASPSALSNAGILQSVGASGGSGGLLGNLGKVSAGDALKMGGLLGGAGAGRQQGGSNAAPQLPYTGTPYTMPELTPQETTPDGLLTPKGYKNSGGWRFGPTSSETIRGLLG